MANNRMYLRCKVCGGTYYLAKNFGFAFYLSHPSAEQFCEGFNDFLERHFYCSPSDGGAFDIEKEWDADESKWEESMFSDEEWERYKQL